MITENEFESLITRNESSILDFKGEFYDFKKDKSNLITAKFVKDIISFSNTIRTETSYIIFGIQELDNGDLEFKGVDGKVDDAILQDKIKDKVIPRPNFSFYTISYKEKNYAILEFPIVRYEMPIVPATKDLKGLEAGKVYYRNGTSNTEATAYDVIRINDWMKSLPKVRELNSLNDEVSKFLKELTEGEKKLSVIISELLIFSKNHSLSELKSFCETELKGITTNNPENYQYRAQMVHLSWHKIEINPYSYLKTTAQVVKNEFEKSDEFFDFKIIMHHTILDIEINMNRFSGKIDTSYATLKTDTKTLLDLDYTKDLYLYLFYDNFINLYKNIRQKAIDILMKI